ncbi:helix-turn-helix domain-containing protein [Janthinobacterium agaricidamnosum]|uniref:helix-turn-helix domain-containing protein n=1 Tax=Janthinobacterium agaricidamnosum TaxID=55508 RepID=UPI00056DBEB7|nr:helix-turn-helix transcriptional regulator [Janthinobacterium agaricidamnosum]
MTFPQALSPIYAQAPQVQRQEIARIRQLIQEMEFHRNNMYSQLSIMAPRIATPEDQLQYVGLMTKIRETEAALGQHIQYLNQMLALVPMDFSRQISDQVKREIYHLYHASRYTQEQLAEHYGVSQSTVHRIVTGEPPPQLMGVNPNSLA